MTRLDKHVTAVQSKLFLRRFLDALAWSTLVAAAAVLLGWGFCLHGYWLWRDYSDALARKTFRFSLIHLSVLFAALLVDHYIY